MPLVSGQFVSVSDLYRYVGKKSDIDAACGGDIDTDAEAADRAQTALDSSESFVISRIISRYELPIDPNSTPSRLKQIVCESFPYFVHDILSTAISDNFMLRHENNIRELDRIVAGKASIEGLVEKVTGVTSTRGMTNKGEEYRRPVESGRFAGMHPSVGAYPYGVGGVRNFYRRRWW